MNEAPKQNGNPFNLESYPLPRFLETRNLRKYRCLYLRISAFEANSRDIDIARCFPVSRTLDLWIILVH